MMSEFKPVDPRPYESHPGEKSDRPSEAEHTPDASKAPQPKPQPEEVPHKDPPLNDPASLRAAPKPIHVDDKRDLTAHLDDPSKQGLPAHVEDPKDADVATVAPEAPRHTEDAYTLATGISREPHDVAFKGDQVGNDPTEAMAERDHPMIVVKGSEVPPSEPPARDPSHPVDEHGVPTDGIDEDNPDAGVSRKPRQ